MQCPGADFAFYDRVLRDLRSFYVVTKMSLHRGNSGRNVKLITSCQVMVILKVVKPAPARKQESHFTVIMYNND